MPEAKARTIYTQKYAPSGESPLFKYLEEERAVERQVGVEVKKSGLRRQEEESKMKLQQSLEAWREQVVRQKEEAAGMETLQMLGEMATEQANVGGVPLPGFVTPESQIGVKPGGPGAEREPFAAVSPVQYKARPGLSKYPQAAPLAAELYKTELGAALKERGERAKAATELQQKTAETMLGRITKEHVERGNIMASRLATLGAPEYSALIQNLTPGAMDIKTFEEHMAKGAAAVAAYTKAVKIAEIGAASRQGSAKISADSRVLVAQLAQRDKLTKEHADSIDKQRQRVTEELRTREFSRQNTIFRQQNATSQQSERAYEAELEKEEEAIKGLREVLEKLDEQWARYAGTYTRGTAGEAAEDDALWDEVLRDVLGRKYKEGMGVAEQGKRLTPEESDITKRMFEQRKRSRTPIKMPGVAPAPAGQRYGR